MLGTDPVFVRATHEVLLRGTEYHGSFGLAMFGIAAIDTALWDCLGKSLGVPCWQLWGAVHTRIPAYAMVGWLNYSTVERDGLSAQCDLPRNRSTASRFAAQAGKWMCGNTAGAGVLLGVSRRKDKSNEVG